MKVYIIGSLRNPQIPVIANTLREVCPSLDVFDDWYAAGPEADDKWRDYEKARGNDQILALSGEAARNVYQFDRRHLDSADIVVLVLPAGKSGHLELGYCVGKGKETHIVFDGDPERYDVMYQFADYLHYSGDSFIDMMGFTHGKK